MRVLDRIAMLIKENPSITVQEIATRLGYSEEKSIYYWLDKARYAGIKDFKKAVLTGEYQDAAADPRASADLAREPEVFLLYPGREVPVIAGFHPTGRPLYVDGQSLHDQARPLGAGAFAYCLPTDEYAPILLRRDLILVDPVQIPENGRLLMLWLPPDSIAFRRYHGTADRNLLIHPITGQDLAEESPATHPRIVGRVLHIIRNL